MPLVTSQGYQLVPDAGTAIQQAVQTAGNIQGMRRLSQEQENQDQLRKLTGQVLAGGPEAQAAEQALTEQFPQQKIALDQQRAQIVKQQFDAAGEQDKRDLSNHVIRVAKLKGMSQPQRIAYMRNEIQKGEENNLNMAESINVLDTLVNNPERSEDVINSGIELGKITGVFGMGTGASAGQREFESLTAGLSPEDVEKARRVKLGLDQRAVGSAAQTIADTGTADLVGGSQARIKELEKIGEKTGAGAAGRQQETIQQGVDAASGYANIKRGLDLLDSVKTGGIDQLQLKAKQLFGIESADEAELSNRMGKAVLSQLRETFGAAFTAKEGELLIGIEANYGKSIEGNRRLLKQVEQLMANKAKRAIKAAIEVKDFRTAADIQDSLDFRFEDELNQAESQSPETGEIQFLGFEQ